MLVLPRPAPWEKKARESVPVAVGADSQQRVVKTTRRSSNHGETVSGFAENTRVQESEHDEEPPQATVAVPEG